MPEHTPAPTPSRAVYGFVLFFGVKTLFILYLAWAIVPEHFFEQINITYLPQRYWAVTIPIFLLTILAVFGLIIYPSLSLCMTPNIDDLETVTDDIKTKNNSKKMSYSGDDSEDLDDECICKSRELCLKKEYVKTFKQMNKCNISVLEDLCIADVSKTLYLK